MGDDNVLSPNGLVDGDYTTSGSTLNVSDRQTIKGVGSVASYKIFNIPFIRPLEIHAGDTVQFISDTPEGQSTATQTWQIGFNGTSWGSFSPFESTLSNRTKTINNVGSDTTARTLYLYSHSNITNRQFTLTIKINGEDVFA